MEVACVLAPALTQEEWSSVPASVAKKLESFVSERFEELITSKALLETTRYNAERAEAELKNQLANVSKENSALKQRLDAANACITNLETQITELTSDVRRLQGTANRLETEAADYRHQRNLAMSERDETMKMLQRRDAEISRLQSDLTTLTKSLESAITTKCEALAKVDEVESLKLRLEYKEKRLDQERQLVNSQIDTLTEDLNAKTDELLNMRRDNTVRCIVLESKLAEKTQELVVANEQVKGLTELHNSLAARNEELSQKLLAQREDNNKMNETFMHEVEAKTKLAEAYKSMLDESQQHIEGLKEALNEVQQLLKNATEQYGELETKHKESELTHEEIIAKKNECIAMLKKELELSKELLDSSKQEELQKEIESMSPSSRLLKSGTTVTELYAQYVTMTERLVDIEKENAHLKNYIQSIVQEVEDKGPKVKQLREDFANALDANELLKTSNEELLNEIQQLRESNAECVRLEAAMSRENARYKKEVADLSRQVCHLLQEIENSRTGSSSTSTDMDLSDSVSSADIITKKLVTFQDIAELQKNNQKLLAIVRDLTERQEEAEAYDPAAISDLKTTLEVLKESQSELLEERERQNKMMVTLSNQRDMYRNLYNQAVKACGGDEVQMDVTTNDDKPATEEKDDKTRELTNEVNEYKKQLDQLKSENELYRKEKAANEKILLEQLESLRSKLNDLVKDNGRLSSQLEHNEEKFKVAQTNLEIYKKQISALEKQNSIYSESVIKQEQAIAYLKDETLQSQTKLSRAEVMLANLQKENALLKDAEQRLVRERENIKRDSHTQNTIQQNIELVKATLERIDAESKIRLEARLDEALRECSALRRRLQEEQDRFRELGEHLKKQAELTQQQMTEEKTEADKLRHELSECREELSKKAGQIEDLSKKLRSKALPDDSVEEKRMYELEQKLSDSMAEVDALKAKLKANKEASEQYINIASNAENQMKILEEQKRELERSIESQKNEMKQLQEKCAELEGELSLQMDDQDIANASKSKSHVLQEELNVKTMDLQTAREQLENLRNENKSLIENLKAVENKYAREVMLHSADLQTVTDMKQEVEKLQSELNEVKKIRDCAVATLEENKTSYERQASIIQREKEQLEQRFKDINAQNTLLLDQIQALNTQLSVIQAQADQSVCDTSLNKSLTDEQSSEQLLSIIKYLRQEKDICVSKAEIIEAEYERLKSQFELQSKQLEEAKAAVEAERQKSEISTVSSAKHAEVLRKVETLNAITDSNRALRQERDALKAQLSEAQARAEALSLDLAPIQEKNRELSIKAEAMQTENVSLRTECTKWRQRAQMLIEKSNRTSPEDWKKLMNERETLAKQLTIERGNVAKLNDEINGLKQDKIKLEEQLKALRGQVNGQSEEVAKLREETGALQTQVQQLSQQVEEGQKEVKRLAEENRVITEMTAGKDVNITELKNNLTQIRKIAKKYKIQCEDQMNEIKTLKEEKEAKDGEQKNEKELQERSTELEEKITRLENENRENSERLNQQVTTLSEENENYKKEIENLKQGALDREERFKNLFKNAKDRIVTLTEQINTLKTQVNQEGGDEAPTATNDLLQKIDNLEKEKADKRQENEKLANEVEALLQKITQLQRQLGQQTKPSTSTADKASNEPPTANIKPMATAQTQSVPIHPWRSAETPLASIRPMSQQVRTVTVLPTSQSTVMVPPQVHTTGDAPSSSHTEYVPATSSATQVSATRQVAVPPTQSSEDEEANAQAPQQQAVALVLPRVEPPSSTPTQEQGSTVTTTQAGLKRQREAEEGSEEQGGKAQQQSKRTRVQAGTSSDGVEVEYQVPTSSQRDHDDDNVIVVESDEEGGPDEGEGADDEPDEEGYDMEGMEQDNYEDVEDEEEAGNEVEVIEDSSEVPNQSSEHLAQEAMQEEIVEATQQPEATSSGSDAQASTSRPRPVAPLSSSRLYEEGGSGGGAGGGGDDGIVPSTPTLFVPRRSDGFGEAVSSPHVPSARFTFNESTVAPSSRELEQTLEVADENSTGRSVPSTPLQASPQEIGGEEQGQTSQSDAEIPSITVSVADEDEPSQEAMGPPSVAGTSSGEAGQEASQAEENEEGFDGVTSEGEKQPTTEEGEEEGREAEASPSTNTRSRTSRSGNGTARRSGRSLGGRGVARSGAPTPIVWGEQRTAQAQQQQQLQQRHPDGRGRPNIQSNYSPRIARRARGRGGQRPYGRY